MQKFLDSLRELIRRKPTPSARRTADWQRVAPAIRQKSFFSATVQSAKVLTSWRDMLLDYLTAATETVTTPAGEETVAFKQTSLAQFRERAATWAIKEGIATQADFEDVSVKSVVSNARLQLVFNTQTEQAQEFAYWRQRVGNADYLNRYPAARFERRPGGNPEYFRPIHVANEGTVRRWDDFAFWRAMNDEELGGFGVPWGPWGFNSYMRQVPVKRAEAIQLGLIRPDEKLTPPRIEQFGVDYGEQFLGDYDEPLDEVPEEIKNKARQALVSRLGPDALDANGNPSLKAFAEARRELRRRKYATRLET